MNGDTKGNVCRDFLRGHCARENCRYSHDTPPASSIKEVVHFCHDYQNRGCFRINCKFVHCTAEEQDHFYKTGEFPKPARAVCIAAIRGEHCKNPDCQMIHPPNTVVDEYSNKTYGYGRPSPFAHPEEDAPPDAKYRKVDDATKDPHQATSYTCTNCEALDYRVRILHDNLSVLLKKITELTDKNNQLTTMNEFLMAQGSSLRDLSRSQPCVITSQHGTSQHAPVSLATVSVTPVVSLAGALPTLCAAVPAGTTPSLALAPNASRAQLLTPAPQIITVSSTTNQLVSNPGTLIVTSAGAQQLMQASDTATLVGNGQTVMVTPTQLTLAPQPQQLMSNTQRATVQQLVQQQAQQLVQPPLSAQQQAQLKLAAAQQSAQHLVAAAQQSAQHLAAAAQHSAAAQHLAAQQSAQQQLVHSTQQLVHQTTSQQITMSSSNQQMPMSNSQAQSMSFPIISQSILPH